MIQLSGRKVTGVLQHLRNLDELIFLKGKKIKTKGKKKKKKKEKKTDKEEMEGR